MTKKLKELLETAQELPEESQNALLEFAKDLEAASNDEPYHASPEELEGIDRGIRDAEAGNFATRAQVEALFAKFLA